MARNLLKKSESVIDVNIEQCTEKEQKGLKCLHILNEVLEAAINLENALISVDADGMNRIATELSVSAAQGLDAISDLDFDKKTLGSWFESQFTAWELYGKGVAAYGKAMASLYTKDFAKVYRQTEVEIQECLEGIMEQEDEDSYTELLSYLEFLRYHKEIVEEHPNYLILKRTQLMWLFNFWGEPDLLNNGYNLLMKDSTRFEQQLMEKGVSVITIDQESLSDLFETVLGQERMKNLSISLNPVKLNFKGQMLELRISVRLYRYGVATVYIDTNFEELTVSDFRVLLSLNGPHSAEYDIQWEDRTYTRLSAIAEEIVEKMDIVFKELGETIQFKFASHLNWYGYGLIQGGLWSRGENDDVLLKLEDASTYPDYKGLLLGQMEARAALDDWVMKDATGIRNLAPIRSHTTDLFVTSENHGVLYFPDDPRWIVLQYQETIETSVRLRCLISTFIEIAGDILDTFVEETSDLAKELDNMELDFAEKRITETRQQLLPVIHFDTSAHMNIELIRGTLTTNYRDHAELMRALIDDLNIDRLVNYLERRLGILSHHQTLFSDIASQVVERRAKERERRETEMENRRTKSMEFVEIFISILAIGEVISILFSALRNLEIQFAPAIEPITYFVAMAFVFLFIMYVRRTSRIQED